MRIMYFSRGRKSSYGIPRAFSRSRFKMASQGQPETVIGYVYLAERLKKMKRLCRDKFSNPHHHQTINMLDIQKTKPQQEI